MLLAIAMLLHSRTRAIATVVRVAIAFFLGAAQLGLLVARRLSSEAARRGWRRVMQPIRRQVEALLLRGVYRGQGSLRGMCRELHDHRDWLRTFIDEEGVEPTNNASERVLRHAVIWRKLSFGTQSAAGSRVVETALSVIETCRQQNRNVFEYIAATVVAHFASEPAPSLLPRA